jgi:hypothetical protein
MVDYPRMLEAITNEAGLALYAHAMDRTDINDNGAYSWTKFAQQYTRAGRNFAPKPQREEWSYYGIANTIACHFIPTKFGEFPESLTYDRFAAVMHGSYPTRLNIHDAHHPHIVVLGVPATIHDGGGRPCPPPLIILTTPQGLKDDMLEYIGGHLTDYSAFIRDIMSRDAFPNVNKGILDLMTPVDKIHIFNLDNFPNDPFIRGGIPRFSRGMLYEDRLAEGMQFLADYSITIDIPNGTWTNPLKVK